MKKSSMFEKYPDYHEPNWQIVQKTRGRLPKSVEKSSGISPLGI